MAFCGRILPSIAGWPAGGGIVGGGAQYKLRVPLSLPWYNGTVVDVTLGNDNSLCLYVCGSFEPNEFAFLDQVLHPGMTFVDVGANDGYYTSSPPGASARRTRLAIEPSSREREHLRQNLERNAIANVAVVPVALGPLP